MEIKLVESFGTCKTFLRVSLEDKEISPSPATVAKEPLATRMKELRRVCHVIHSTM